MGGNVQGGTEVQDQVVECRAPREESMTCGTPYKEFVRWEDVKKGGTIYRPGGGLDVRIGGFECLLSILYGIQPLYLPRFLRRSTYGLCLKGPTSVRLDQLWC